MSMPSHQVTDSLEQLVNVSEKWVFFCVMEADKAEFI